MSTAPSWPELRRAAGDVRILLGFRAAGLDVSARRRLRLAAAVVAGLTVLAVVVPAYAPLDRGDAGNVLALLPSLALAFLGLVLVTSVAAAGGRELVPREEAVALPVSTTADHLGALVLAPLNAAWVLQAWVLLGATAYAVGPDAAPWVLPLAVVPVLLWLLVATALAQALGWCVEGVRRGPRGRLLLAGAGAVLATAAVVLVLSGRLVDALDSSPTIVVLQAVLAASGARWWLWAAYAVGLLLAGLALVALGAVPARWALRRPMRAELAAEGGARTPRRTPRRDLVMVLRLDRASVWRSVPLRRGVAVLAVFPGLVALAGRMPWSLATVLPGLVAAGGALLFGVNAWCLDARGALWRESLPVRPRTVFLARTCVLLELLLGAALVTLLLVALGAGVPRPSELLAVACCTLVVGAQVVGGALRWSQARPYAVDLRSARATPAPPVVMVGYSARLAIVTTITSLLFSTLGQVASWPLVVWVALMMLMWSTWRWERVAQAWEDPVSRSRVVAVVTG